MYVDVCCPDAFHNIKFVSKIWEMVEPCLFLAIWNFFILVYLFLINDT